MSAFWLESSWLIPFYGLIGAVATLPWSLGFVRRTGQRPAAYLNLLVTAIAFVHGSLAFVQTWAQEPQLLVLPWFQVAGLHLDLAIELSPVSLGAMEMVAGISLLAQLYALGYMEKDWSLARFFGLMGFFEAALSGIAISDSLLLSYALLEMLTLSTYLLVGFWYAQPLVVTAARDAFLTKRVGDIILLMGLVALSSYGEGLSFSDLESWAQGATLPPFVAALLGLSLIAGPTGKCAQFPLHLWLDEAMEGPSPASILRNSIVVSAGAYVLIELQPVFALSPIASNALLAIGTLTCLGASLMALAQIDIKRALSHSTSAYMGLVFIAVGLQQVDIAFLLLFTHALAKALLFTSSSSVILTTNAQDMTEMGGLGSRMPATTLAFVVGALGATPLVPLGTFWVLRRWMGGFWDVPWWLVLVLAIVNGLGALNLTRVFRLVFLDKPQAKTLRAPEVGWAMALSTISLTIVVLLVPLMLQHWQLLLTWSGLRATEGRWPAEIGMPLLMLASAIGCWIGLKMPVKRNWTRPMQRSLRFLQDFLAYDFYIDRAYRFSVVWAVAASSKATDWLDRHIVDGTVDRVGRLALWGGQTLKYSASGQVQFYALTIAIGIALFLLLVVS